MRIVTDSDADYTAAEIKLRGISCVPMSVTFGVGEYLDGVTLTKEEFYEKLKDGTPKKSQHRRPFLAKRGRLLKSAAGIGNLVNLRPVIALFDEGERYAGRKAAWHAPGI